MPRNTDRPEQANDQAYLALLQGAIATGVEHIWRLGQTATYHYAEQNKVLLRLIGEMLAQRSVPATLLVVEGCSHDFALFAPDKPPVNEPTQYAEMCFLVADGHFLAMDAEWGSGGRISKHVGVLDLSTEEEAIKLAETLLRDRWDGLIHHALRFKTADCAYEHEKKDAQTLASLCDGILARYDAATLDTDTRHAQPGNHSPRL